MKRLLVYLFVLLFSALHVNAEDGQAKNVLILVEGDYNLKSIATAEGRQLQQLMGHWFQ